ncbi:hypothetical protein CTheo_6746 [Ceratobasidium theobromae]|uniref:Jacalin-type lectin domain-containing protein n=1 Tax=Ceratobasidium theobromae TaxID=1582974 RepID=A0A5N5QDJ6_9AGAM|nr:hypothetical protein CTheo_6746 [Ceratobasidium theobromae]
MRQVATRKPGGFPCARETDEILVEAFTTANRREFNYIRQGWAPAAASVVPPWTSSRMTNKSSGPANEKGEWVTKRYTLQQLTFDLLAEELEPVPDFVKDVENALAKPTKFEKFQAIYRTLHCCVILILPEEFDCGASFSMTMELEEETGQLGPMNLQFPDDDDDDDNRQSKRATPKFSLNELSHQEFFRGGKRKLDSGALKSPQANKPSEIEDFDENDSSGGGNGPSGDSVGDWLAQLVPPEEWRQVRVRRVVPTTDLLNDEIRDQLATLYSGLWSYSPLPAAGVTEGHNSVDDDPRALGPVSSVSICSGRMVDGLKLKYIDGTQSNQHGKGGKAHDFLLDSGEHITEVLVWMGIESGISWIYGIQFITTRGKVSRHYGGSQGQPTVLRSKGGVLVGLRSTTREHPELRGYRLTGIQAIWRHDIIRAAPKQDDIFSDYIGSELGAPFNDRVLIGNSRSMNISAVEIGSGTSIDYIRLTYDSDQTGEATSCQTMYHGSSIDSGGRIQKFSLEPGEYITAISGRYTKERITRLGFTTNKMRSERLEFGGAEGEEFIRKAPSGAKGRSMGLQYLCGKRLLYARVIHTTAIAKVIGRATEDWENTTILAEDESSTELLVYALNMAPLPVYKGTHGRSATNYLFPYSICIFTLNPLTDNAGTYPNKPISVVGRWGTAIDTLQNPRNESTAKWALDRTIKNLPALKELENDNLVGAYMICVHSMLTNQNTRHTISDIVITPIADLFGVRADGIDGPRISMRQVATRKSGGFPCARETDEILVEAFTTRNQREFNYIRQGWAPAAASVVPPWTSSRMTNKSSGPANKGGEWVTKRYTLQQLTFDLLAEELEPVPNFVKDVKDALAKPTKFEKFQAIYRILHCWGDVIPLVCNWVLTFASVILISSKEFDCGVSFTMSKEPGEGDTSQSSDNPFESSGSAPKFTLSELSRINKNTARITRRGGKRKVKPEAMEELGSDSGNNNSVGNTGTGNPSAGNSNAGDPEAGNSDADGSNTGDPFAGNPFPTKGAGKTSSKKTANGKTANDGPDNLLSKNVGDWLAQLVPPEEWRQVRVRRVVPTTDLLDDEVRDQLATLYSGLWSYSPLSMAGVIEGHDSVDDDPRALGPVSSVSISSWRMVDGLKLKYIDGTQSNQHGTGGGAHEFLLDSGEHITEVLVWMGTESGINWVYSIQFITTRGRVSRHYGGSQGQPTVLRSKGGALVGLRSTTCEHPKFGGDRLTGIQASAIWRHDIIRAAPKQDDVFSDYIGSELGTPFNDRVLIGNSRSMNISAVEIGSGTSIDYIRVSTSRRSTEVFGLMRI